MHSEGSHRPLMQAKFEKNMTDANKDHTASLMQAKFEQNMTISKSPETYCKVISLASLAPLNNLHSIP